MLMSVKIRLVSLREDQVLKIVVLKVLVGSMITVIWVKVATAKIIETFFLNHY